MAETLNSSIDLLLSNTPIISEGTPEELYEALLKIHQAIEILVAYYDASTGLFVTTNTNQTINAIKSFDQTVNFNGSQVNFNGSDVIVNSVTRLDGATTSVGYSVLNRVGFWDAVPILQPAAANQAALTNSTGGAYDGTLANVTGTASLAAAADGAITNANFTDIYTLLNEIRTALVNTGLIKGAA